MYWMSVEHVICASHELTGEGAVRPLHGHNWRITAHVCAAHLDSAGQVLAPDSLESELWTVIDPFDHRHLNDLAAFSSSSGVPPSAAGLARLIAERLALRVDDERVRVRRVDVEPRDGMRASWDVP